MDCKEFEKLIPEFIEGKLDYPTLKKFSEHMEQCEDCKEELTIQFLVTEGIQRLEDGSAFDLQKELSARMAEAKRKIRFQPGAFQGGRRKNFCPPFGGGNQLRFRNFAGSMG